MGVRWGGRAPLGTSEDKLELTSVSHSSFFTTGRVVMLQKTEEKEHAAGNKTLSLRFSTRMEISDKMRKARIGAALT